MDLKKISQLKANLQRQADAAERAYWAAREDEDAPSKLVEKMKEYYQDLEDAIESIIEFESYYNYLKRDILNAIESFHRSKGDIASFMDTISSLARAEFKQLENNFKLIMREIKAIKRP